jgi:hypothetical protein
MGSIVISMWFAGGSLDIRMSSFYSRRLGNSLKLLEVEFPLEQSLLLPPSICLADYCLLRKVPVEDHDGSYLSQCTGAFMQR